MSKHARLEFFQAVTVASPFKVGWLRALGLRVGGGPEPDEERAGAPPLSPFRLRVSKLVARLILHLPHV